MNNYTRKILEDGWRNAVFKVDGVLDTSDASLVPAIALNEFNNNDTQAGKLVGFRIDHVWHSIGDGLEAQIVWSGSNERIMAIAGRGRESFEMDGGLNPDQTLFGYAGDINIYTTGYGIGSVPPVQNFTILLEMVKLYKL